MDYNATIEYLKLNFNIMTAALFILLVVSEILGENQNIKASSLYGVVKNILLTIKDQIFPKTPVTQEETTKPDQQ